MIKYILDMNLLMRNTLIFFLALAFASCNSRLSPVEVSIEDPVRHYYPVIAGEKVSVSYEIRNEGKSPLVISEIQPSCGCVNVNSSKIIIPGGKKAVLNLEYDSSKNLGYVHNVIRLYGNFSTGSMLKLEFDLNVVPHADYIQDYEELVKLSREKYGNAGNSGSTRDYYVGFEKG